MNKKFLFAIVLILSVAAIGYVFMSKKNLNYQAFATSSENLKLNIVPSSPIMEGTPEGDLLIADPQGSKIFAKGGLNYVIAKEGPDKIFYSLCSTKMIDNKVNVVEGFNVENDKLYIFCAHNTIKPEAIKIIKRDNITYVQIKGKSSLTAIALLGDIDIKVEDIELNKSWSSESKN